MNKKDEVAVTSRSFSKNKTLVDELRNRYEKVTLNTEGKSLSGQSLICLLYTSPSPRDISGSRMPSSA